MISFNLTCSEGHEFGGWFSNSDSFEKQVKKKQITCPTCGDTAVSKSVMAPVVGAKSAVKQERKAKAAKVREMLTELRDHVEKNFDDVSDEFPEEARRIYYGGERSARHLWQRVGRGSRRNGRGRSTGWPSAVDQTRRQLNAASFFQPAFVPVPI